VLRAVDRQIPAQPPVWLAGSILGLGSLAVFVFLVELAGERRFGRYLTRTRRHHANGGRPFRTRRWDGCGGRRKRPVALPMVTSLADPRAGTTQGSEDA
jgi:hypothetical protein